MSGMHEKPADVLELAGVQFEVGKDAILSDPTLSLTCAGHTHGPYVFSNDELGAIAAWLNDHAEAGGE